MINSTFKSLSTIKAKQEKIQKDGFMLTMTKKNNNCHYSIKLLLTSQQSRFALMVNIKMDKQHWDGPKSTHQQVYT